MSINRRATFLVIFLAVLAVSFSLPAVVPSQQTSAESTALVPFACSPDFYQVVNNVSGAPFQGNFNRLYQLDPQTGNYSLFQTNDIGAYNAISYNVEDNFIYGLLVDGRRLMRISANGIAEDLGTVSGLPNQSIFVGAFDLNGNLYVRRGGDMYRIDVNASPQPIATKVIVQDSSGSPATVPNIADWGFIDVSDGTNPNRFLLAGVENGGNQLALFQLDGPTDNMATLARIPLTGDINGETGAFGANYPVLSIRDELFVSSNNTGNIFRLVLNLNLSNLANSTASGAFTAIGTPTGSNDGASCATSQSPFPDTVANDDTVSTPQDTAVITNVVANDTAVPGNNVVPSSVSINANPANGTVANNGNGTITYTPDSNFSGSDTYIYEVCNNASPAVCDEATVSITVVPSNTSLTWTSDTVLVSYEDLKNTGWSDWDYNDFVVQVEIRKGLTTGNDLSELEINYEALARGAGFSHRFLHELPLSGGGSATLTVWDANDQVIKQDTSSFGSDTTFAIFERTRAALPPLPGYFDTNTRRDQTQRVDGHRARLAITLNNPSSNASGSLPPIPWDAYIEVLNSGEEVHLLIPGHLDNVQTVNDTYEANNPMIGYDLPLAQVYDDTWKWPLEFAGLWRGYPRYVDYFGSGGTTNQNWHNEANSAPSWLWLNQGNNPNSLNALEAELEQPNSRYFASPVTADLDGDGKIEIVIGDLIANQVEVRSAIGGSLPGWPKDVGGGIKAAAAVADLDGDGDLEIIVGAADGTLYAWHHNGQDVQGWPVKVDSEFRILATPAVGNLNGDNKPEIVVPLANGRLFAYSANGQPLPGWPVSIGGVQDLYDSQVINSSPSIVDLNGDGQVEIVVGSTDKQLYVFNTAGKLQWTYATGDMVLSSPFVADIDPSSAGKEIAFGSGDGYFYLLSKDGQLLWKRVTGWTLRSSPTAADLDENGDLELLIGGDDDRLWAWHHDGSLVAGWPQAAKADLFSSPSVGDLDGDGDLEVAVGSDDANVYAWHADGKALTNWPKKTNLSVKGSPALANLDEDSDLEVVVGDLSGQMFIWNYQSPGQLFLPMVSR